MPAPSKFSETANSPVPSLSKRAFPFLTSAYTKLSNVSRTNLFRKIKYQIILLYILHYVLNGLLYKEMVANILSGFFFTSFLFIALQPQITDVLQHVNGAFLIMFGILMLSHGDYSHKIGMQLPQLSLLVTNNMQFAVFLQSLMLPLPFICSSERLSINDLYSSTVLVGVLIVILHILKQNSIETDNLKAQIDSLDAQLKSIETRLQESKNFNKGFHLTVSHEFRNPLNNVMGNLDLMQKNLAPEDQSQEQLKMAKMGCEILLNGLNNILDFCKAEADEIDINYVSANIRKTLEKGWSVFSELLKNRGLHGELYLHASVPPMIMVDTGRLHQILFNLVHNASKFTQKGFVKVIVSWHPCFVNNDVSTASASASRFLSQPQVPSMIQTPNSSTKRPATPDGSKKIKRSLDMTNLNDDEFSEYPCNSQKITFSPSMNYNKLDLQTKKFPKMHKRGIPANLLEETLGFLKIQVIDSGVGIHNSNLNKLFQKFSKFSFDSLPRVEGSGLGLWITKQICNKMGGSIHVHSDLNKGSTFLVFLKCEVSPQSLGTPTPSPALSGRRDRSTLQTMASMPFMGSKPKIETNNRESGFKREDQQPKLKAMVVDDIPYNQHLNKQFLELCGVEVKYIVENGLEAYKKFVASEQDPLDFIFMDLDMPVMDGRTSCIKIREWEKKNKVKPITIVILTGNCSEDELKQCLDKSGPIKADFFYRKPLPLSDCQNLVQQLKREKNKKRTINLPIVADYVLFYEKDLFQQVLLENYLRVGQIKYFLANRGTILEKFTKNIDSICVILYNCENVDEALIDGKPFIDQVKEISKRKLKKEVPILGIVKEMNNEDIAKLRGIGFRDFLVKPFDYENIVRLLKSHTMNGLPM